MKAPKARQLQTTDPLHEEQAFLKFFCELCEHGLKETSFLRKTVLEGNKSSNCSPPFEEKKMESLVFIRVSEEDSLTWYE